MALRIRLTLWYSAVLLISLVLFGVFLYAALNRVAGADIDSSLAGKADDVSRGLRVRGELSFLPPRTMLPRSAETLAGSLFYVQLLDAHGRVVDRSESLAQNILPVPPESLAAGRDGQADYQSVRVSEEDIRLYTVPVQDRGNLVGYIQVGRSQSAYGRAVGWLRNLLFVIGSAMVVVASGVGYLVARAALSPLTKVTQAARAIGLSQRLDRRLPPHPQRDEIGDLMATFNEMLGRLEGAFAAQRRFVSDASHELRTPLTTIRGNVAMLQRGSLGAEDSAEALQDMADEAERMSRLISELLDLARADAGRRLDLAPVRADALVQDVFRQAQLLWPATAIRLGRVDPSEVLADADYLRRLLLILVENAVKYNRRDGVVGVSLTCGGERVRIAVSDCGPGIALEDLPRIFDRFYRAPAARGVEGTGLGLAIAQWIAEQHDGRIAVETSPGEGSTFTVDLPSRLDVSSEVESPSDGAPDARGAAPIG